MSAHLPVMRDEVLTALAVRPDGCYLDATFGRGGHSAAILEQLGDGGRLLALDRDDEAVAAAREQFATDPRFTIRHVAFAALGQVVDDAGLAGQINGLFFDFGVSSPHLDDAERGFSFMRDGVLDMRMDRSQSLTAASYLATVTEIQLRRDLRTLGEERLAARIAKAIIDARARQPIERTLQLADIVEQAVPARVRAKASKHPATRTFQAIRIRVNDELDQLQTALQAVPAVLAVGGRVCFLTFHSLEDRPVKRFLQRESAEDPVYRGLPDMPEHARARMRIIGKQRSASAAELAVNPRSRSARLRVGERLR
ncbi:MAG: 16S rRNA (cytosine(1402)-N(4))-methyltransferase RsmH [Pseudomonadota bacterium]